MPKDWYARTRLSTIAALRLIEFYIPARIAAFKAAIATGSLPPDIGRGKISHERGWATRAARLVAQRVAQGVALPTEPV
jgi:hypothetical protein